LGRDGRSKLNWAYPSDLTGGKKKNKEARRVKQ